MAKGNTCFVCNNRKAINVFADSILGEHTLCDDHADEFIQDEAKFIHEYKIVHRLKDPGNTNITNRSVSRDIHVGINDASYPYLVKMAAKNNMYLEDYVNGILNNEIRKHFPKLNL